MSIGMSACNSAFTLLSAVASLQAQTYENWRLLLIDAASTDATADIATAISAADHRVTFTPTSVRHRWPDNALTHLEAATGEFFMWADADDVWEPNWIAKLLEAVRSSDAFLGAFGSLCHFRSSDHQAGGHIAHGRSFGYTSCQRKLIRLSAFDFDPESGGKANLLYSLWRTESLRSLGPWRAGTFGTHSDVAFCRRALLKGPIASTPSTRIFRRLGPAQSEDAQELPWLLITSPNNASSFMKFVRRPRLWVHFHTDERFIDSQTETDPSGADTAQFLVRSARRVLYRLWARAASMRRRL